MTKSIDTKASSVNEAVRIARFGSAREMKWEPTAVPVPGPGEAVVEHSAVGLNYLDIHQREGRYPLQLPSGLGVAGAGVVTAVGVGVTEVRPGDQVAYAGVPPGSYAHARSLSADRLVPLPKGIEPEVAAATLQQGITACFLLQKVYAVQPGATVLFHAAAGGVGTLACQWAKSLGAQVIGAVSSDAKAAHAKTHGCDHVIVYGREDVVRRVRSLTDGHGAHVVYDSVGLDTYETSLYALRMWGTFVSFGSASGLLPLIDIDLLAKQGSLYLTRPRFVHYAARRADLLEMAASYFALLANGSVKVHIGQRYRFSEVVLAHHDMEHRVTMGSSVLVP